MRALTWKLLRDLWTSKGQGLAIALVIAGGVATYVMSLSTLDSLRLTQAVFYRDYRFAHVFATVKRAPETLRERIAAIEGVRTVQTQVVTGATLDLDGNSGLIAATVVSLPDHGEPLLNRLHLRKGRFIDGARDDEALVSDSFAQARRLQPGDRIQATIYGRRRSLRIVGIALSPEYIYQIQSGTMIPDFENFGVLWMARTPLENACELEGAFNTLAIELMPGASEQDVIGRLDDLLRDYGGLGAFGRKHQISHRYLFEEFRQLESMATIFPAIFLSVAAFLLNVVVSRLLATEREQMAILKAFGYTNAAIVRHYLKYVLVIVAFGSIGGVLFGMWLGRGMSNMYMDFYRFPYLVYRLRPEIGLTAALISAAAAILGTLHTVIRAARIPPAEAMQPAPPTHYRVSIVERLGLRRLLGQPTRMILRNIERRPVKSALSVIGIGFACAIMVVGGLFGDAVDHLMDVYFKVSQTDDITVGFTEPVSRDALYSLAGTRGVAYAEGFRSVPVTLRFEHRSYRTSIQGYPEGARLRRLLNTRMERVTLPPEGVVLTDYLAGMLGVRPGDRLIIEVLEGRRPVREVAVAGLVSEFVGVSAYMDIDALNRMMREGPVISGASLTTLEGQEEIVYQELKAMPRVAGATVRMKALENFYEIMARQVIIFSTFEMLLAGIIAFGVVYNGARIALSERSRELASLRVLGFTRGEISYILLGEMFLLTLAGIPAGFVIGRALSTYMVESMQTELFRIPVVIEPSTYSLASVVILVSSVISAIIVKRKLDHLDLVAVLKTKE